MKIKYKLKEDYFDTEHSAGMPDRGAIDYRIEEQNIISKAVNWFKNRKKPQGQPTSAQPQDAQSGITDYAKRIKSLSPLQMKNNIIAFVKPVEPFASTPQLLQTFQTKLNQLFSKQLDAITKYDLEEMASFVNSIEDRKKLINMLGNYISAKKAALANKNVQGFSPEQAADRDRNIGPHTDESMNRIKKLSGIKDD